MKRKTIAGLIAIVAIVAAAMFVGCIEQEPPMEATRDIPAKTISPTPTLTSTETPMQKEAEPIEEWEEITEEEKQRELLATAVSGSVWVSPKNWDSDAEDDGIIIYPDLKDNSGETVKFENIELPVKIKIYTTKYTEDFKEVKDRLVYSGTGTINSWEDGNFFFAGGIKVSFEDISSLQSEDDYGWVYATITLPDGRTIEAVDKFARIKQE